MARIKQTKGKQKIEIKRIEQEEERLVTFSKRKSGICKKASELITLCGVEIAVLIFSPAGKPFTFGHPSFENIANRFLGRADPQVDSTYPLVEAHRQMRISQLTQEHNEVLSSLDVVKDKTDWLKRVTRGVEKDSSWWWEAPVDELSPEELNNMYAMFEHLHTNLCLSCAENGTNGASSAAAPSLALVNNNTNNLPLMGGEMMNNPIVPSNPNQNQLPYGYGFGSGSGSAGMRFP